MQSIRVGYLHPYWYFDRLQLCVKKGLGIIHGTVFSVPAGFSRSRPTLTWTASYVYVTKGIIHQTHSTVLSTDSVHSVSLLALKAREETHMPTFFNIRSGRLNRPLASHRHRKRRIGLGPDAILHISQPGRELDAILPERPNPRDECYRPADLVCFD